MLIAFTSLPGFVTMVFRGGVYLSPADNSAGPGRSRPRDVKWSVLTSAIGLPRPGPGRLSCP
jgi:hypothetical protein